jgi:putative ABC transport system permease protein
MNTQIVFAGLRARPVRTAVGILAVTLEVVLILLLVGVTTGTVDETGRRVSGIGAEILIKDEGSSYFLGMNSAILPVTELGGAIAAAPGVKAVAPVITDTDSKGLTVIYGIDPPTFDAVSGGFQFIGKESRMFNAPNEAVIDNWQAAKAKVKVGDTIQILKEPYIVSGIVQNGKGARIFIPIKTLQDKEKRKDLATMFYVKLNEGVETKQGIAQIEAALAPEKYEVLDVDEFVSIMFEQNADLLNVVFDVVVFLGVVIGVLVIFLSMYTTVTERTREIGILRSMGASKGMIVSLVLEESLLLCLIGTVVGIGSAFVIGAVLKSFMPTLVILIGPDWILKAAIYALLSGVIGSIYPAYKAASQDPIEALAYE